MTQGSYTDAETGIKLKTWTAADGAPFTFGLALPSDALTKDATEYIGLLVGSNSFSR
jgi:cellobiose dehydrogenase (acceptor)